MSWGKATMALAALATVWLIVARWSPGAPPPPPPEIVRSGMPSPPEPARRPAEEPGTLFDGNKVLAFAIEIDPAGIQRLREQPRQWVKGTVRAEGGPALGAEIHIKGSQGSLQSIDQRPALTVSFSRFEKGQRFHGLRKIHFNNSAEDPSFVMEVLCSELCRKAGLPAARAAHATLSMNGRKLGLYVLKEGLTKDFLRQYFADPTGNLYDGGFRQDIDQPLERIGGSGPDDQADRKALLGAAREADPRRRWERLQQVLDVDRFIDLLAMTTIMWNWDGYPMARNNYRIYHDPSTGQLVFIPHGLDQMFWEPAGTIFPPMRGLVAAAVMRVPEGRRRYRERLVELHQKVLDVPSLHQRADELAALIRPYRRDAIPQIARLKAHIEGRAESIAQQLRARD